MCHFLPLDMTVNSPLNVFVIKVLNGVMLEGGMRVQSVGTGLWTVEDNTLPHSDPYLAHG